MNERRAKITDYLEKVSADFNNDNMAKWRRPVEASMIGMLLELQLENLEVQKEILKTQKEALKLTKSLIRFQVPDFHFLDE